jgi:phosphoglycolate phosphatase-like HAD superfamily hydrolase
MINHISFDLDGTMINSIPLMRASWNNVCKKLDLKIGWSVYSDNIGLPFDKICENLKIDSLKSEVKEIYFEFNKQNIDYIEPMPGLIDCCIWLKEQSIEWSIITSKPKYTTLEILDRFKLEPKILITCDDTLTGKPTIAPAELLRNKLDQSERTYYYIGDTLIDHLFSINAGFNFVKFHDNNNILLNKDYSKKIDKYICNKKIVIENLSEVKNITNY